MYSQKNLAKSFDFGKNGVNKSFHTHDPLIKINDFSFPMQGYPERWLLIIERNGDLIIPKN